MRFLWRQVLPLSPLHDAFHRLPVQKSFRRSSALVRHSEPLSSSFFSRIPFLDPRYLIEAFPPEAAFLLDVAGITLCFLFFVRQNV